LSSIRNSESENNNIISGKKYPFQIIVQQDNVNKSKVITLDEIDFILLCNFIKDTQSFLDNNIMNEYLKEEGNLHIQNNFTITLTNHNR